GIGALLIGLGLLIVKWGFVKAKMQELERYIKTNFAPEIKVVRDVVTALKDAWEWLFGHQKIHLTAVYSGPGSRLAEKGANSSVVKGAVKGGLNVLPGIGPLLGSFAGGGTAGRAGRYLVGEEGPEVVELPAQARVTPIDHAAAAPAGAGGPITVNIAPSNV